ENIFMINSGDVLCLNENEGKIVDTVTHGDVLVDGLGVGDVGNIVIKDRQALARDGIIVVALALESYSNQLIAGPDIVSRGFVYVKESEDLLEEARVVAFESVERNIARKVTDWNKIKSDVRDELGEFIWKKIKRNPMILPIIQEV
ncbi:MAG: RNase J family beta-CASP ribonuclease, partial [Lachnospiraceae bacterium]|nr:RNase J family beta-CASP ribonuclease [Lachnospiraceae bacterium]